MTVYIKRAYETADVQDGYRVLVDRLWPRGVSKEAAQLDDWLKDIAPSDELRRDFHQGTMKWDTFRRHYLTELTEHREALRDLAKRGAHHKVTLVYSAKDEAHNNAVVLQQYLAMLSP